MSENSVCLDAILYVDREKEKSEVKDRKVLTILQTKDSRLDELESLLRRQETELMDNRAR